MTFIVRIPDLAEQLAEIIADPTAYVRRTRELARRARPVLTPFAVARCTACHPLKRKKAS